MNISGIKLYSPDCFDIGIIHETSGWRILWKKIIAVIGTTFAVAKRKPEKIYNEPVQRPAPSWLVSLIVRALQRYHRGVKGSNPLQACIFSGFLFATAKSCVYNCDDILLYNSSPRSSHVWFSYIHNFIIILSWVKNEPIQRPAPSWLVSSIGRALQRYRRGQGLWYKWANRSFCMGRA